MNLSCCWTKTRNVRVRDGSQFLTFAYSYRAYGGGGGRGRGRGEEGSEPAYSDDELRRRTPTVNCYETECCNRLLHALCQNIVIAICFSISNIINI